VEKLAPGATTPTVLPFTGLSDPYGVAVDTAGNVYVADHGANAVVKLPAR
jgi:serine/threonine-protein kinase